MARDYNRLQSEKALARARYVAVKVWRVKDPADSDKLAHRLRDNLKKCSCEACRNKRGSAYYKGDGKLTMQERRHA